MKTLTLILSVLLGSMGSAQAGDSVAGKQKANQCIACHGDDGNPAKEGVPKIDRMASDTFIEAMHKMREAHYDIPITAHALSEEDLQDIAAYLTFSN